MGILILLMQALSAGATAHLSFLSLMIALKGHKTIVKLPSDAAAAIHPFVVRHAVSLLVAEFSWFVLTLQNMSPLGAVLSIVGVSAAAYMLHIAKVVAGRAGEFIQEV